MISLTKHLYFLNVYGQKMVDQKLDDIDAQKRLEEELRRRVSEGSLPSSDVS